MQKINPSQTIVLIYLSVIIIGALLLKFPFAVVPQKTISFIDALFTATSAVCVTGLVVKQTGIFFSWFGKLTILLLFQVGGIGIMTISTLFALILGRKLTIRHAIVMQNALDIFSFSRIKEVVSSIIIVTFSIEALGMFFFLVKSTHYYQTLSLSQIFSALFHSVSAFCNAGFSLHGNLTIFSGDSYYNVVFMGLIVAGGLGFMVLLDFPKFITSSKSFFLRRVSLQTKIVLITSAILILVGAGVIFILEYKYSFQGFSIKQKILASLFQSVSARTAGFNTVLIESLSIPSAFVLILLMFIGASPGSCGGGIKTTTIVIIVLAFFTFLRGKERIVIFGRTIPTIVFRRAFSVFIIAIFWIVVATLLLCITEKYYFSQPDYFIKILFEVVSAFSTVGLSMGITSQLSWIGKIIIICTMVIGRIGPITLALALVLKDEKIIIRYPEEKIMVG